MTPSDRRRVEACLARWQNRYCDVRDRQGSTLNDVMMAAVDWLRAEVKLAAEYVDDEQSGWAEQSIYDATVLIAGVAEQLAGYIRDEMKTAR